MCKSMHDCEVENDESHVNEEDGDVSFPSQADNSPKKVWKVPDQSAFTRKKVEENM